MKRKPIMLDAALVDELKAVAEKHGMSLSAYMRSLISAIVDIEKTGIYAPKLLKRATIVNRIQSLGMSLLPLEPLEKYMKKYKDYDTILKDIYVFGKKAGLLLYNLDTPLTEVIAFFIEGLGTAMVTDDKIIVSIPHSGHELILYLLKGIAEAYMKNVELKESILIISLKKEKRRIN